MRGGGGGNPKGGLEVTSLSAIEHIVTHRPDRIERLILPTATKSAARVQKLQELARAKRINVDISPVGDRSQDPVKAYLAPFQYTELKEWMETVVSLPRAVVLALDHLQDPQNFGALCRTAEGLGIAGILLPKDRSVAVSAGVYSASVGAVETVPIVLVNNLAEALRKLKEKNFWVLATQLGGEATPPSKVPDFEKTVLVLGAEWEGMSHAVDKICDWRIEIPLPGKVQSLNVSAAGAILMWELTRPLRT